VNTGPTKRKKKKTYPPNPLPCGCGAKGVPGINFEGTMTTHTHIHVVHCPLHGAAPELLAVAKRYEAWEAKLILCQKAWEQSVPTFTQELLDEWMEIQAERNAAVRKAERGTT
jgi:hypothetical protein